jgi:hypothetical protein
MPDFSIFQDVPGLLTPAEQGNVKQNAMLSAAAGLLKSAGYSKTPVNTFQALGEGLSGGLAGYKSGMDDALKTELLRGNIEDRKLNRMQMLRWLQYWGALPGGAGGAPAAAGGGATPVQPSAGDPNDPTGAGLVAAAGGPAAPATGTPQGLLSAGGDAAPAPGGSPAGPLASTAPGAMPAAGATPVPFPNASPAPGSNVAAGIPPAIRQLIGIMGPQAGQKMLGDYALKAATPTDTQKDRAAGIGGPEDAAAIATAKGIAEAKTKDLGEIITAGGRPARQKLNTLAVMEDAIDRAGPNLSTGPGADFWLKAKQTAQNLFPSLDIKGLPESEVVSKLNAQLAAEAAKSMTSRPSQLEFNAFMKNNPGLMTSVKGTKYLINVLKQTTQQDIGLRRLAMDPANTNKWQNVEDNYYKQNPIKSPFTGNAITGDEKIETPPVMPTAAPAASGPPVGFVRNGYRFKGGNPNTREAWEPVK